MMEIAWSQHAPYPLLALLQLLPLAGALLLWVARERLSVTWVARGVAFAELLLAWDLYRRIELGTADFQFAERVDLFGPFAYHAAADGITVLFVLLAALLGFLLTIYATVRRLADIPLLLTVILAVESVLISLLCTVDLLWFTLATAVELGLVGLVLWRWAISPEKGFALVRFFQFQGSGLLLLLAGTLTAGWSHADATGVWSFALIDLSAVPVTGTLGTVVFFLLFYGLAVRTPLFPMHGWLPTVAHHGNVAVAPTFLLGVKVGIYGLVRFVFPITPEAVAEWHGYAVGFAVVGVFFGAFLAFLQSNLRRLIAFAVVSHTSLVALGLFTLHHAAFQGAVLLAINFGLAATAMLFMVGFVYRRTRTTALARLGGLFDRIPFIGLAFFIAGLAIVGMPGTPGFDAAHLVFEAAIERFGALLTVAAALGNVLAAGFLLWAFQRAFLAPTTEDQAGRTIEPTTPMEFLVAATVIIVLLFAGFYMEPWLDLVDAPLRALSENFTGAH
ncbi:complex I subunit 4 family protein [Thiohalomonas denitrificans]|uniref:NADH-quinone oxidoreductase subunit M n=1 Tax=Thiohalomonas denitrificans TaxID=415747 RepID=A0A1G5R0G6_9GAMM|nr:NADH-quinone oxidoreductase subunit M [Thiohalomonas denitrificans]SCZ66981.1 NADH-quinone oxidoreductase subunit M [Thiohalomonas denitrificans]